MTDLNTLKKTAVVILNWNGRQFLEIFLPMIVARSTEAEIWVADNGSTDDSLNYLTNTFPSVQLLPLEKNYGYTGGYNLALSQISADYYILLNSDIEVAENWLSPLIETLESDDTIAAVQPKILSFAEKTRFEYAGASGGFIDCLGYPFCRGRFIGAATEFDCGQYDDARQIFWATGAALLVRGDVFKKLGGLDEHFFAHMEEIDLCWRFKRAGYKIMVEPRSVVYHVGGGTLPVWSSKKTYLNFRNNIAMLYKNLSVIAFILVYCVRMGTDFLRFMSYALTAKWSFAAAIFRGHRDFWRMRKQLDRQNDLGHGPVGQIYKGSIVLRQVLGGKTFGKMMTLIFCSSLLFSCGGGPTQASSAVAADQPAQTPVKKITVIAQHPHDKQAYTQGLLFDKGKFYESTGEYGRSSVRRVDLATGKVEQLKALDKRYFGEGLELLNGKLYQVTWQESKGFIYDLATLNKTGEFSYDGEGWGLATDGTQFYMSNGTNRINIYRPGNFGLIGRLEITDSKGPVDMLNELEWIDGKIWANIYYSNRIAMINPKSGKVEQYLDASLLETMIGNPQTADVLNGIAYDKDSKKIYVTGKDWDTLFEIKINE